MAQLSPLGSGFSIALTRTGDRLPHADASTEEILNMASGSLQGLQLVVPDVHAARADLVERRVEQPSAGVRLGFVPPEP